MGFALVLRIMKNGARTQKLAVEVFCERIVDFLRSEFVSDVFRRIAGLFFYLYCEVIEVEDVIQIERSRGEV